MSTRVESVNPVSSPAVAFRQHGVGGSSKNETLVRRLYEVAEGQDAKAFAELFANDERHAKRLSQALWNERDSVTILEPVVA